LVLVVLLLPISVSAGPVGDFLSSIFKSPNVENLLESKNIQNMALLVAVATPLANNQIFNSPTIENDALVSSVGPSGNSLESLANKPTSDQISVYVVHEGDTISQIAEMFDVTVNTIKWSNDLSSNTLKVGETLVILPISGVEHTVVKGDTIASIAKKYKGDINEIIAYNNLQNGNPLALGSTVIVPDGEVVVSSSYSVGSSSSGFKEYVGYYLRPIVGGKKTQGVHGHNGVDLSSSYGSNILASAGGDVIISRNSGWNGGYGDYIVLKHNNGTQTLYAHLSATLVSVGDHVTQGQVIGKMGNTGNVKGLTGVHLHFEIRGAKNSF